MSSLALDATVVEKLEYVIPSPNKNGAGVLPLYHLYVRPSLVLLDGSDMSVMLVLFAQTSGYTVYLG